MIVELPRDPQVDNRNAHVIAIKEMMSPPPHSEEDAGSVMWVGTTRAPDDVQDVIIAEAAALQGRDAIVVIFDSFRDTAPPRGFTVMVQGGAAVHVVADCKLWAPADGGPSVLVAPDGRCYGWDGRLLTQGSRRSMAVTDQGVARAKARMRRAVAEVPAEKAEVYAHIGALG